MQVFGVVFFEKSKKAFQIPALLGWCVLVRASVKGAEGHCPRIKPRELLYYLCL